MIDVGDAVVEEHSPSFLALIAQLTELTMRLERVAVALEVAIGKPEQTEPPDDGSS